MRRNRPRRESPPRPRLRSLQRARGIAQRFSCLACILALAFSTIARADSPTDLLTAGRVDDAIQTLQQQLARSPNDGASQNLLCRAYFMLDDWDHGIPACEHAVALDSTNALYHLWLGRIYGEKADRAGFLSAIGLARRVHTEFETAVDLAPSDVAARTDLAEFYLEAPGIIGGSKDKARAQAETIARLDPAAAHWVIGRLAERAKDQRSAEREFRAAIDSSHGGARAWLNLAIFFRHTNRLDQMEQALITLESRPLDRPESLMDGASLLLRTGRNLPLAVRLLRRYLQSPVEQGPAFKAHSMLGQVLEKQGDRAGATDQFRAALALAHTYAPAKEALERVEH
ncbi:MAG: tetratricopeptide repeat protein [Candidatus Sulfotelmatobacter sp.]